MNKRLHLIISGRVQGVFFRVSTQKTALQLGLTGWVRNLPGQQVEVLAEGDKNALQELLTWCQHGPKGARVEHIEHTFKDSENAFTSFLIR